MPTKIPTTIPSDTRIWIVRTIFFRRGDGVFRTAGAVDAAAIRTPPGLEAGRGGAGGGGGEVPSRTARRERHTATAVAPRPNSATIVHTSPPKKGISARTRSTPHPARNAFIRPAGGFTI